MVKNNDFAVIDIGTNNVKCICFANGMTLDMDQDYELRNKILTQKSGDNINPDELLKYIKEYIEVAKKYGIDANKVYIVATEAFRKSTNKQEISNLIGEHTKRNIHIISPKREAYLSALGGLIYIRHNFKTKPNKILYIESGGGSTEVSLLDTGRRSFLSMITTISIPLGSKDKVHNDALEKHNVYFSKLSTMINDTDNLSVVINSTAAGRILASQNKLKKYIPAYVAKKQLGVSTDVFSAKLDDILLMTDEDIQKNFYIGRGDPQGFVSHCKILSYIIKKSPKILKAPLTTTIGGLKLGVEKEIERSYGNEERIMQILGNDKHIR